MTKARMDSHRVIRRCFQITPVENQSITWLKTSIGVEKKNGGSSILPNTGTVEKNCQSASATTATRSWSARSITLDIVAALSFPLPPAGRGQGGGYSRTPMVENGTAPPPP